jgi:hypothetical protein
MCVQSLVCIPEVVVEIQPKELGNEHRQPTFSAEFQLSFKFGMPIQDCAFLEEINFIKSQKYFCRMVNAPAGCENKIKRIHAIGHTKIAIYRNC